ncbi:MAG: hypothetical protein RML94_16820, partial [Bacteroidia bacterium]|nr:hypothetical protein [Bacteroidia bacterium]
VQKGSGDTLILKSPTLGTVKVKGTVVGNKVNLQISPQEYTGSLRPSVATGIISTTELFYFIKENNGKKYLDSNSGNGIFNITLSRAGNKYQVAIRRTGVA